MITLHYTSHFLRNAKKLSKNEQEKLLKVLEVFKKDPFHPSLKTHKLKGTLSDLWSFSITYKLRVLFRFVEDNKVLLYEVGTHSIY